jgi:Amt family ammonium transporter
VIGIDDSMDIFAVHGLAGIIGLLINGFFGTNYIPSLDGILTGAAAIPGGWFSHHWVQMGYQVAYICATCSYSFVVTAIILYAMNIIPGLSLRVSREAEREGIDEAELGEFAFDFVEVRRDFDSWNAPDPNLIEGRVREELEKQQEELANASTSTGTTRYSSQHEKTTEEGGGEGRAERALENGEVQPSGRGGGEIEVQQKSKAL